MNTQNEHRLAEIFQSGMLFQRDKRIVLWGNAAPDTEVTAALYKDGKTDGALPVLCGSTKADSGGSFFLALASRPAGKGYLLCVTFQDVPENSLYLKDISFGDLWLAGGQSNMEFFLKYERDWENTRKLPRNPDIHMYNVPQRAFEGHTSHNKAGYGYWFDDSDPGLEYFSAPAYSFARNVQTATGVPIGIIGCNWGGSTASAWVPEEALAAAPLNVYLNEYESAVRGIDHDKLISDSLHAWAFEDSDRHVRDFEPLLYGQSRGWQLAYMERHKEDPAVPMGPCSMNRPCGLYHTMLLGLIPLSLKGVLWYQGESDAGDHAFLYDRLLTALIESWRAKWNDGLPFLIVQLAPFGVWLDCDNKGYALVRQKQAFVAKNVPAVYMAGIMDLGSYYDIHPKEKMEVGRRLALLARGHIYGEKELLCDAPEAVSAFLLNERQIGIVFAHGSGLTVGSIESDWNIRIGQQDFLPDKVFVKEDYLVLTLPCSVSDDSFPVYVSLGWKDYARIYIYNAAGLSALPFQLKVEKGDYCEKTSF